MVNNMRLLNELILESLDSDPNLEHAEDLKALMIKSSMSFCGHSNVSMFTDGKDHYSTSKHDGAIEIHHFDFDDNLGSLTGNAPNPRFISNIRHLAKPFLDRGDKVRFVTSEDMHDSIKKLASRMNRSNDYIINSFDTEDPERYGAPSHIKLKSLEIQKSK